MPSTYNVRLCDVSSTPWRRSPDTTAQADIDNTDAFDSFYTKVAGQVPGLLAQRIYDSQAVRVQTAAGGAPSGTFSHVEVVLFALPFPADQIVAVLALDFATETISNESGSDVARLLRAATESQFLIDDVPLNKIIDDLAQGVRAVPEKAANPGETPGDGERERHALVFADGARLPDDADRIIPGLLYGIQWPYRPEFTALARPEELNREAETFAAVSARVSFFYGQRSEVDTSVLLTTVQAVGTAARFQRIWHDAYYHVKQFQSQKLRPETGTQTRKDLENLADEMGNLELDLAFSVETAADLGLGSTMAQVDSFHQALYKAMQIRARAHTVGEMFVRLGGSIRSELTAIESREKERDDQRRLVGALALGILTFLLAPLGVVLGFFGVNAKEIDDHDTMFDWHRYWYIYTSAGVLIVVSIVLAIAFWRVAFSRASHRGRR